MPRSALPLIVTLTLAASPASTAAPAQTAPAGYRARELTPAAAGRDVALIRRALEMVHPGLHRYTPKRAMDSAFAALARRAESPITDVQLYAELSRVLAAIHCDHTKAEYPAELSKYRREQPTHLPFRFKLFDGRMYVASSDPEQPALARGAEVLSINGVPVGWVLAEIEPMVAYDGLTSFVRAAKLEADSDLLGSDFEHFYPILFGFSEEVRLELREPGAAATVRAATLRPISYQRWTTLPWDGVVPRADFATQLSWRMIGQRTALMRVGTFVNYRTPADPDSAYGAAIRGLLAAGVESLVIDLRPNSGGSDDARDALARALAGPSFAVDRPSRLKAVRYGDLPQYVQSWGDRKTLFEPPLDRFTRLADGSYEERPPSEPPAPRPGQVFDGPVTVLTGPANASGATMLVAALRDAGRVRLVGEPTGGSAEGPTAGQLFFVKLPESGITVRVPVQWSRTNVRAFRPGLGVTPDVVVRPTLADFLAGRDPVLEAATR